MIWIYLVTEMMYPFYTYYGFLFVKIKKVLAIPESGMICC